VQAISGERWPNPEVSEKPFRVGKTTSSRWYFRRKLLRPSNSSQAHGTAAPRPRRHRSGEGRSKSWIGVAEQGRSGGRIHTRRRRARARTQARRHGAETAARWASSALGALILSASRSSSDSANRTLPALDSGNGNREQTRILADESLHEAEQRCGIRLPDSGTVPVNIQRRRSRSRASSAERNDEPRPLLTEGISQ
jgi:hypothetical protein